MMVRLMISMKNKIVLISYPFDDQITFKVRPALCLTEPISDYKHIIMSFISSQIEKSNEESDIVINISDREFSLTGLNTNSAIRLYRIATIPINLIKRELGILPNIYHNILTEKLRKLFDI